MNRLYSDVNCMSMDSESGKDFRDKTLYRQNLRSELNLSKFIRSRSYKDHELRRRMDFQARV